MVRSRSITHSSSLTLTRFAAIVADSLPASGALRSDDSLALRGTLDVHDCSQRLALLRDLARSVTVALSEWLARSFVVVPSS